MDVEQVANEVHDAEPEALLSLDVSSDEGLRREAPLRAARVQSAALSVNTGRQVEQLEV